MITRETLLDAARRHFRHVGGSPSFTREARNTALQLAREIEVELAALDDEHRAAPAWDARPEPLRRAA